MAELESMLENVSGLGTGSVDVYISDSGALYSHGVMEHQFEPMVVFDTPNVHVHLHNDCAAGSLQYPGMEPIRLNAYESAIADYGASNLGLHRTDLEVRPWGTGR